MCPNAYAQGGTFKAHLKTHIEGNSVDKREVKTFKSKHENFRDYYLKRAFFGASNYSGTGRPLRLRINNDDKSVTVITEVKT